MSSRYPLLALALLLGVASPVSAQSLNPAFRAHVWADNLTAASYTPDPLYAYNPAGAITVSRSDVGRYLVTFAGLGAQATTGIVNVTAYQSIAFCRVTSWGAGTPSTDLRVGVACDTPAGAPVDAKYNVMFTNAPPGTAGMGYVWSPSLSASSSPGNFVYNASGGEVTITRPSEGHYTVTFTGLTATSGAGTVIATAYGATTSGVVCQPVQWDIAANTVVNVECRTAAGFVDNRFTVLYLPSGSVTPGLGFTWASEPTAASYNPWPDFSYNGGGGTITVSRAGTGNYGATFQNVNTTAGGHVQVAAYSPGHYCFSNGWGTTQANVGCVDMTGAPVDARYTVVFTHPDLVTSAEEAPGAAGVALQAPAPNPTAGTTALAFTLDRPADMRLAVYDALGREVAVLADGLQAAGLHEAVWEATGMAAGVYVVRLTTDGTVRTRRVVVAR